MLKENRPLNDFISCECGIKYVSGYLQCPKCGERNEDAYQIQNNEVGVHRRQDTIFYKIPPDTVLVQCDTEHQPNT